MFLNFKKIKPFSWFTLIELLIVIAILAILATVTLLVINPAQMIKQTRDSNRIAELNQINKALLIFQSFSGTGMGTNNTIYISLPDTDSQCGSYYGQLTATSTGWNYHCSTTANYRKVDGNGWIPVDLTSVQSSAGTLFSALPIDPVNTAADGYYYTYIPGSWALSATMESDKYLASNATTDGGSVSTRFETGNELALNANLIAFSATGGTITEVDGYKIHTFTSSGTFAVTGSGNVEVLVVAGGGGGGGTDGDALSGGGGAGGLIYNSAYSVSGNVTVTVGLGGAGGPASFTNGANGENSVFGTLTSIGGGGGGGSDQGVQGKTGSSGGSGGGGGQPTGSSSDVYGGSGTSGQGYAGGAAIIGTSAGGGGGGASAVGYNSSGSGQSSIGGAGGAGLEYSQFSTVGGSPVGWFAGGGGGGGFTNAAGGSGGGGQGADYDGNIATAGTNNTGGGGGGAGKATAQAGANGGSGIVIVRYPL